MSGPGLSCGVGGAAPDLPGQRPATPAPADWGWKAERVLRRFGTRAVPALAEALQTAADPAVRRFAAVSLARLGAGVGEAAEALRLAARDDRDPEVRQAAGAALATLGSEVPARRVDPR